MSTTISEMIEVMQHFAAGGKVQVLFRKEGEWKDTTPIWDWSYNDYRKKLQPIECWVTILDGNTASTVHMNKENADAALYNSNIKDRWSVRRVVIE